MPYSVCYKGKVLDYSYKKLQNSHYAFYIGDIYIGQLFNTGSFWSCVSNKPEKIPDPYDGFKTRHYAAQFLLKINKYI